MRNDKLKADRMQEDPVWTTCLSPKKQAAGAPSLMSIAAKAVDRAYFNIITPKRHMRGLPDVTADDICMASNDAGRLMEILAVKWNHYDSVADGRYPHDTGTLALGDAYPAWLRDTYPDLPDHQKALMMNPSLMRKLPSFRLTGVRHTPIFFGTETTLLCIDLVDTAFVGTHFSLRYPKNLVEHAISTVNPDDLLELDGIIPTEGRYPEDACKVALNFGYRVSPRLAHDNGCRVHETAFYMPDEDQWQRSNPHKTFKCPTGQLVIDYIYTVRGAGTHVRFRFDDDLQLEAWFAFSVPASFLLLPPPMAGKRPYAQM
jgi:hypothetical protein